MMRQILPQMPAPSWSRSSMIIRHVSRFRSRFLVMIALPRSISMLPSSPRSNSMRFKCPLTRKNEMFGTNLTLKPSQWLLRGAASGLFMSVACAQSASADCDDDYDGSTCSFSHGKKVVSDYTVTGIPGDGRCLFRSLAHGACIRSGKGPPAEALQRQLADELRSKVADEFIKRREETEWWFIEGDFDSYVSQMRKPHEWGGEPEIVMATHVLGMPITVYMHEDSGNGLIAIAEYGQEYGKEDPIRVLYHGYGHYEALQIPSLGRQQSKL